MNSLTMLNSVDSFHIVPVQLTCGAVTNVLKVILSLKHSEIMDWKCVERICFSHRHQSFLTAGGKKSLGVVWLQCTSSDNCKQTLG